jgi:ABC-2 type transport system ATP-binding protein
MTEFAIEMKGVEKAYRFFRLRDATLALEPGQIMGFVGPNGAGKSTTIRILMALIRQDRGDVRVLGKRMPYEEAEAKRDVGYFSDDMQLYGQATFDWHMRFVASIYPGWDGNYAAELVHRFNLHPGQQIRSLSHGERTKAALLLVLARRPRLLLLDEPTTGLDPVARHEILHPELGELRALPLRLVARDEERPEPSACFAHRHLPGWPLPE